MQSLPNSSRNFKVGPIIYHVSPYNGSCTTNLGYSPHFAGRTQELKKRHPETWIKIAEQVQLFCLLREPFFQITSHSIEGLAPTTFFQSQLQVRGSFGQ